MKLPSSVVFVLWSGYFCKDGLLEVLLVLYLFLNRVKEFILLDKGFTGYYPFSLFMARRKKKIKILLRYTSKYF